METEVIRISISENKEIMEILSRMYEIKNIENKDVECEYSGEILTTKECDTFGDLLIKNNNAVFGYLEREKENLLQTSEMKKVIEDFKSRGKKYDGSELEPRKMAADIWENTKKFDIKMEELETLDFTNPTMVYEWLNSIIEFVNNHDLHLAPGLDKSEYKTSTNYIVKKLEEKGYTNQIKPVNNFDDYYRRLISYQLDDLTKYGFFAYDYANDLKNNNIISENRTERDASIPDPKLDSITIQLPTLEELIAEKNKIEQEIKGCNNLISGTVRRNNEKKFVKSISFEEEKENILKQIQEKESISNTSRDDEQKIIEEARNAVNNVKTIAYNNNNLSMDEQNVLKSFYNTEIFPKNNEFINTLELAMKLPEESSIRESVIDAIIKLSTRYNLNKDLEEKEELAVAFEKLGIKNLNNNNSEIESLKQHYKSIEVEEGKVKKIVEPQLATRKDKLNQINKQIEEIKKKEKIGTIDVKRTSQKNNENADFIAKLEQIASEGPVFVDLETRLDKTDQWMDKNTAIKFGKLDSSHKDIIKSTTAEIVKNEEISNPVEVRERTTSLEEDLPIVTEDSLAVPHPIKNIKKASIKLIEKVRGMEFNKKVKQALDFIKEKISSHKKVVASALIIGGIVMLGGMLNNSHEVSNNNVSNDTKTESMDQIDDTITPPQQEIETPIDKPIIEEKPVIEETKTDTQLMNEAIEETINGILNGDDVYSNKYNALNEENGFSISTSQKENSWTNAEASVFYGESAEVLNRDQAEEVIANGGEVVARFDNNGVPIGYAVVGDSSNIDASGISK